MAQIVVVARIAGLGFATAWPLIAAGVAGAALVARRSPATAWMIGWGGFGMTLGWWADLDFRSAIDIAGHGTIDAIWCRAPALDAGAHGAASLGHLLSWMNAGMLLAGVPAGAWWMSRASLLRCTIGMLVGMSAGAQLAAIVAADLHPIAAVIADYVAMSVGMGIGMVAFERLPWPRVQMPRNAAIATSAQPAIVTRNPSAPA